jgi:DNA polymerase elongation subunit (family B)|tara:strand:- start:2205 stop:2813 length:609 start_codon:yes stop_codon:yes gene_type:complete
MSDILALDIETSNYSWEIGGWDKTASFDPTVVATWNGKDGTVYCNKSLDIDATVKALHPKTLGDDLIDHVNKGGVIIGHNIKGFDLPVLRDALDCWSAGDLLGKTESVIDTKILTQKAAIVSGGVVTTLDMLVKTTLEDNKLMNSEDAPVAWRDGKYDEVAKYCLSDARLTYDFYEFGKSEGYVQTRKLETGEIIKIEVDWK